MSGIPQPDPQRGSDLDLATDRLWAADQLRERLLHRSGGDQAGANAALPTVIREVATELRERWVASAGDRLREQRRERADFEVALRSHWGQALDAFELLVVTVEGVGSDVVASHGRGDDLYELLLTLHARATQLAHEVHWNLVGGYPNAADARCRTLHEVVVSMRLLGQHGRDDDPEIVTRFREHELIGEAHYYRALAEHHESLGMSAPDARTVDRLQSRRKELLAKYGKSFAQSFGWAADHTRSRSNAQPGTIAAAEAAVGMSYMRPVYARQSDPIHAGAAAARVQIAAREDGQVRLSNVTMRDLGRSGYLASDSLLFATNTVVGYALPQADPGFAVCMEAVRYLAERAQAAFLDAEPED